MPSSLNGSGQTIVVVEAFGSPTIQDDLRSFDATMNLPDPALRIFYPLGQPSTLDSGWATETSLDVEWAHAIAPGAQITLVVAPTNQSSDLHAALAYAVGNQLGSIISMSFGEPEPAIPGGAHNALLQHADSVFQRAKAADITLIASTGDTGATNGETGVPEAVFPASDPLVTAVGGTSLFISDTGNYERETVWNDSVASLCPFSCRLGIMPYATGGAPSAAFKTPSYQHNVIGAATREVADVSYNAGIYTAVLTYMSFNGPNAAGLYFTGGTSCGAPQWAGIVALANQAAGRHLGYINPLLYNIAKGASYHSAFHDVTVGNDGFFGGASESAKPGYDMPTGLGTPNVANLIPALVRAQE
jgi:subtilase family serine protease